MTISVFIDGAVGTTGLEIRERLGKRAEIDVVALEGDRRKDASVRREALNEADFVILCLPDEAARDAVAMIDNSHTRVIDASTAHRTAAGWAYGFPELDPDQEGVIAGASRVANPGCYPTGFLALVRPLVRFGLLPADWPVSVHAVSGYSGGGKSMIEEFERGDSTPAWRGYALGLAHKHVPEMQRHAGLAHPPIFTPSVANTYRGMVVEVPLALHALPGKPTVAALTDALCTAYDGSRIVRVRDAGAGAVTVEADAGTDRMTLSVHGNDATGQAILLATLDNLGKGASGAAVQNLNIMAGFDPAAGLIL